MEGNAPTHRELEGYRVRPAHPEDGPAMAEAFLAAGRAAWGFAGEPALAAMRAPEFPGGELVAEDAEGVAGFAVLDGCELDLLYTHPRVWGRGAGHALLAAAEAALREAGCHKATLWTEERNLRPRGVYEAAGWRTDGEVRERVWNGAPLRELRYRKPL
jgi:GNAT superfamily N-acetyltransferase